MKVKITKELKEQISRNVRTSLALEGIKTSDAKWKKIQVAAKLLEGII